MDHVLLISLVKGNPELYCTTHPNYAKIKLKEEIWEHIAAELNSEAKLVKEQWRKLRDCHREALRRQKSTRERNGDTSKAWIYQREMSFLLSYMKNRPMLTDLDICDIYKKDTITPRKKRAKCLKPKYVENIETPKIEIIEQPEEVQHIELETDTTLSNKTPDLSKSENPGDKDALHHFFMSMYCATKALPIHYQRQIRNQIFNIISQTEEQFDFDQVSNEPLNHMDT